MPDHPLTYINFPIFERLISMKLHRISRLFGQNEHKEYIFGILNKFKDSGTSKHTSYI